MKFVEVGDLKFMTASTGHGRRLLFLSGSNGDLRKSPSILDSRLGERFEVLSFDQRGMGQSSKPDRPYSMVDYATDALGVMDAYGWDEAAIVGYSFGGMVAQEIAIRTPERVSRLVLAATTAGGAGGSSYPIQEFSDLPPLERARRSLEVADLTFTQEWQTANPAEAERKVRKRMANQARFKDEPGAAIGVRRQLEARATHDTFSRLTQITCPTLVVAGKQDGQAPSAAQKAMADAIPNSEFRLIEGTHQMLSEGDQTLQLIAEFCSR